MGNRAYSDSEIVILRKVVSLGSDMSSPVRKENESSNASTTLSGTLESSGGSKVSEKPREKSGNTAAALEENDPFDHSHTPENNPDKCFALDDGQGKTSHIHDEFDIFEGRRKNKTVEKDAESVRKFEEILIQDKRERTLSGENSENIQRPIEKIMDNGPVNFMAEKYPKSFTTSFQEIEIESTSDDDSSGSFTIHKQENKMTYSINGYRQNYKKLDISDIRPVDKESTSDSENSPETSAEEWQQNDILEGRISKVKNDDNFKKISANESIDNLLTSSSNDERLVEEKKYNDESENSEEFNNELQKDILNKTNYQALIDDEIDDSASQESNEIFQSHFEHEERLVSNNEIEMSAHAEDDKKVGEIDSEQPESILREIKYQLLTEDSDEEKLVTVDSQNILEDDKIEDEDEDESEDSVSQGIYERF